MAGRWRILAGLTALGAAGCAATTCYNHQGCGDDEVCWDGVCEPVTDRSWTFELVRADVGVVHPDRGPWDDDGSEPDLYAEFGLSWDTCVTSFVPDAYDPVWYRACDFYVPDEEPAFSVDLWDADGAADELATHYAWEGAPAFAQLVRTAADPTRDPAPLMDPSGTVVLTLQMWPR